LREKGGGLPVAAVRFFWNPSPMSEAFFTEPTTGYWQEITADIPPRFTDAPPYRYGYPVRLPNGGILVLPLRQLPSGDNAVASLIANQAAHVVIAALADAMAERARTLVADMIVGLPTLGFAFSDRVAERLGHPRFVPLGYSRKFWYDDVLSEAVQSITSPEPGKLLRLDPNMLPLLEGRRIVLVDDAISSGATAVAAVRLLRRIGVQVAGIVVAMKQTNRWQAELATLSASPPVRAVYGCPLFRRGDDGWWPLAGTQPAIP
jgi:adenine/guanine phosphoribosyltransferase-like PRPP-binding protein